MCFFCCDFSSSPERTSLLSTYKDESSAENFYGRGLHFLADGNIEQANLCMYYAAQKGHSTALGKFCLYHDEYEEAFQHFSTGAAQGLGGSQFQLGLCYFLGKGTAIDHKLARLWLQRAKENQINEADQMLQLINMKIGNDRMQNVMRTQLGNVDLSTIDFSQISEQYSNLLDPQHIEEIITQFNDPKAREQLLNNTILELAKNVWN